MLRYLAVPAGELVLNADDSEVDRGQAFKFRVRVRYEFVRSGRSGL